ncbi:MAG: hypothetical protein EOP36_20050 [Rubrivivax sp.]|nr:MAG: hypothetical protein EOP36_20050 [Rubrivivax sp.]
MKKIFAEVVKLSNNSLYPRVYCVDQHGVEDEAICATLCDLVWESNGSPLVGLEALIVKASTGQYSPEKPELPDFSINDKMVWVRPPFALEGKICISNENILEYSANEGSPQSFTKNQFKAVSKLVSQFSLELVAKGRENLLGQRFEIDLPTT